MKRKKEESINKKLKERFEEELKTIHSALHKKGGTKKIDKVWVRIGRAKEKNKLVSGQYQISVKQKGDIVTDMNWEIKENPIKKDKQKGVYFIRTSYNDPNEKELWDIYNTIREVESTFRCLKKDLKTRPVHHQNDQRVQWECNIKSV